MSSDGDILDELDDTGELARSIEAGREGPWHDATATFVDPKLKSIEEKMRGGVPTEYRVRRMRDLSERGVRPTRKARNASPTNAHRTPARPDAGAAVSLAASALVVSAAAGLQMLASGWDPSSPTRALAATIACGVLWHTVRRGRAASGAMAAALYFAAFTPMQDLGDPGTRIGLCAGLAAAMLGGALLGARRRHRPA